MSDGPHARTPAGLSQNATDVERPWLEARCGRSSGFARRHHRQPWPWIVTYQFVPDDAEDDAEWVIASGQVLGLGVTRPHRREQELAKRRGPIFPAMHRGRRGAARRMDGTPLCFGRWYFIADDDGTTTTVADTDIETYHSWGEAWESRLGKEARKLKRRRAMRRGPGSPADLSPSGTEA